jgi:tetratricopeptide (TPR) repeat protein
MYEYDHVHDHVHVHDYVYALLEIRPMQKFHTTIFFILSAAIFICCPIGCQIDFKQSPIEKDGKLYGITKGAFRNRWWNYYERGLSFLDGGFWNEAETDFREALTMWDKDQRRIRTYGRHLTDYFPHRELGIALFHQKRYAEAIDELEASLSTEKSAKAEFYLDKSRKIWIEQENLDTKPPDISVEFPETETFVNTFAVSVTGVAEDDTYIKDIQINGKPVRIDLAAPKISFRSDIPIKTGENTIVAEVTDLTGKAAKTERKIFCDRAGPTLNIDALIRADHSDKEYIISGYAHDDSGIKEITLNGREILKDPVQEIVLNHPVVLSADHQTAVVIAKDQAGNETRAEISPSDKFPDWHSNSENVLLASLDTFPAMPPECQTYSLAEFPIHSMPNCKFGTPDNLVLNSRGMMTRDRKIKRYEKLGNYYALLIGIDKYDEWPGLENAVSDVSVLRDILINRYDFSAANILLRTDKEATWEALIDDLRYLAGGLNESDNLLIYFSGHGQLDSISGDGYWIPVDGKPKNATTWITNSAIRNILCSPHVRGKNIMIIADACYSGTLLRGEPFPAFISGDNYRTAPPETSNKEANRKDAVLLRGEPASDFMTEKDYQHKILQLAYKKSRQVISSGGIEPVSDAGEKGAAHSLFAYHFLNALRENKRRIIDLEYLFHTRVWGPVAEKGGQRPVVGRLKTDMDENGQFVMVLESELADKTDGEISSSASSENPRNVFSDRVVSLPDSDPPVIEIAKWAEKRTVFIDQAFLELKVRDEVGIQKVRINGQDILSRPGRELYLNYLASLDEGDNIFLIECLDQLGNRTEQKIQVHRKLQKIYETGSRMSVLLMPFIFEGTDKIMSEKFPVTHLVDSNFLKCLIESKRFNIKNPLNQKKPAEDKDILDLAWQAGADFVLKGKGIANAGKKSLEISVQLTETETSESLTYEDVYGENIDSELIAKLCQGLAVKLRDALPLVEGRIVKIDGKNIIINLGEANQIKKGMHLIFFEEGEVVRDVTGEILGMDTKEVGTARIRRLLSKMSHTELFDRDSLPELKIGQQVITK